MGFMTMFYFPPHTSQPPKNSMFRSHLLMTPTLNAPRALGGSWLEPPLNKFVARPQQRNLGVYRRPLTKSRWRRLHRLLAPWTSTLTVKGKKGKQRVGRNTTKIFINALRLCNIFVHSRRTPFSGKQYALPCSRPPFTAPGPIHSLRYEHELARTSALLELQGGDVNEMHAEANMQEAISRAIARERQEFEERSQKVQIKGFHRGSPYTSILFLTGTSAATEKRSAHPRITAAGTTTPLLHYHSFTLRPSCQLQEREEGIDEERARTGVAGNSVALQTSKALSELASLRAAVDATVASIRGAEEAPLAYQDSPWHTRLKEIAEEFVEMRKEVSVLFACSNPSTFVHSTLKYSVKS